MPHADNAVGTLHPCEKPKGPHDVRPEGGKGAIAQCAAEGKTILLNMEGNPLTAKAGLPDLNLKRPPGEGKLRLRILQPPRLIL